MRGYLDIMSQIKSQVPEIKEEIKNGHWHIELKSQQTGQRKSSTSQIKNLEFKNQNQRDGVKTRVKTEGVSGLSQHPEAKGHHPRCDKNLKNQHGEKDGSHVRSGTKRGSVRYCIRPQNPPIQVQLKTEESHSGPLKLNRCRSGESRNKDQKSHKKVGGRTETRNSQVLSEEMSQVETKILTSVARKLTSQSWSDCRVCCREDAKKIRSSQKRHLQVLHPDSRSASPPTSYILRVQSRIKEV